MSEGLLCRPSPGSSTALVLGTNYGLSGRFLTNQCGMVLPWTPHRAVSLTLPSSCLGMDHISFSCWKMPTSLSLEHIYTDPSLTVTSDMSWDPFMLA